MELNDGVKDTAAAELAAGEAEEQGLLFTDDVSPLPNDQGYRGPVLIISGFDRRVLESAFRLGEALGLTMAGPLEKPARLEDLEAILIRLKPSLAT